jgi:hypothetical protein
MGPKKNFWSILYERSQRKMMYLPTIMGDRTVYFKNVLSEPDKLIEFINECDLDESTHNFISKWKSVTEKIQTKEFIKNEDGISKRNIQKLIYIYNSFYRVILFCKEHYLNFAMKESTDLFDLSLIKISASENFENIFKEEDEDTINFYILINPEEDGIPMCVNKKHNIYINPEPNTAIMIPGNIEHYICVNKKNDLYYIKGKFNLNGDRLVKTNIL